MTQADLLVDTLKRALKARQKTYADVGQALKLSTASVKRLFTDGSLSLKRLDAICEMLDIQVTDLLQGVADEVWHLSQSTEAQEEAIAKDIPLLLITVSVLNLATMADIIERFHISEHECIRRLAWLDGQGLIDLLPKNRIKLKVSPNFAWRPHGPIQQFFLTKLGPEYLGSKFSGAGERLLVLNGLLADESLKQFHRKMEKLAQEFEALCAADAGRPVDERTGHTVVLAVRSWIFGAFKKYLR